MFESLLYDEEGLLVLNLKQIQADYVSGQYKLNPYGKVYVSCPTGYYPLFAYLSRIAGMKDARAALKKFRADKMAVLDRDAYTTIKLQRENELEDLLRRSFYYYYYADADQIRLTDKFLEAFQEIVYNSEYDFTAFCEGVEEDVHANPEAWKTEQKAFAHGLERMANGEHCDSVDATKDAVKEAAIYLGKTEVNEETLQKMMFEQATAMYYINCIGIVAERYASPVFALPEYASVEKMETIVNRATRRKRVYDHVAIFREDIDSVKAFVMNESEDVHSFEPSSYYDLCSRSCERSLRGRRAFARDTDYESVNTKEYDNSGYALG